MREFSRRKSREIRANCVDHKQKNIISSKNLTFEGHFQIKQLPAFIYVHTSHFTAFIHTRFCPLFVTWNFKSKTSECEKMCHRQLYYNVKKCMQKCLTFYLKLGKWFGKFNFLIFSFCIISILVRNFYKVYIDFSSFLSYLIPNYILFASAFFLHSLYQMVVIITR